MTNNSNNSLNDKLIELAKSGHTDAVELCLKLGVDIHAQEDYALCRASHNGHTDTVRLLLDKGADIHAQEDDALRWAANNGHTDIVRLLLDKGANKNKALVWLKENGQTKAYNTLKGTK